MWHTTNPTQTHDPIVHVFHHRTADAVERMCKVIEEVLCRELSRNNRPRFHYCATGADCALTTSPWG